MIAMSLYTNMCTLPLYGMCVLRLFYCVYVAHIVHAYFSLNVPSPKTDVGRSTHSAIWSLLSMYCIQDKYTFIYYTAEPPHARPELYWFGHRARPGGWFDIFVTECSVLCTAHTNHYITVHYTACAV